MWALQRFVPPLARSLQRCHYSMELKEVVTALDRFASPSLAESWDNVGLLVQPYTQRVIKTIFLTNDLSEEVMAEAVERRADLILSYHPPLFRPFKRITTGWKDRIIACCLEKGIAIYSPHTAYDTLKGGVNDWLIKAFDVHSNSPLQQKSVSPTYSHKVVIFGRSADVTGGRVLEELRTPFHVLRRETHCLELLCNEKDLPTIENLIKATPEEQEESKLAVTKLEKVPSEQGAGRRGNLREPITIQQAVTRVKEHLGMPHVRVAVAHGATLDSPVRSVAVCAGSGASVLRGANADLWLTGEMSHHEVLDAVHSGTTVILVDHSNSERGYLKDELQPALQRLLEGKVEVQVSQKDRDPLQII